MVAEGTAVLMAEPQFKPIGTCSEDPDLLLNFNLGQTIDDPARLDAHRRANVRISVNSSGDAEKVQLANAAALVTRMKNISREDRLKKWEQQPMAGHCIKLASQEKASNHWLRTGRGLSAAAYRTTLLTRCGALPTLAIRWSRQHVAGTDNNLCRLCKSSAETAAHVLHHCPAHERDLQDARIRVPNDAPLFTMLQGSVTKQYTDRHNEVVTIISRQLDVLEDVYKPRVKRIDQVIHEDWLPAGHADANLRPDIVIERGSDILLADVRCSWSDDRCFVDSSKSTLQVAAEDKKNKYARLAETIQRHTGKQVQVLPLIFGSCNIVPTETANAVCKLMYGDDTTKTRGAHSETLNRILHRCATATSRHNHHIWISHLQTVHDVQASKSKNRHAQAA
jgi:hypothetical protein